MQLVLDCADEDLGGSTPDFHALYAFGFRVAIFRRSECYYDAAHAAFRLAHDQTFARLAPLARAAGLVVGAYLFPDFSLHAPSAAEQVANFDAAGGTLIAGTDLPPMLDIEYPGKGVVETGRSQTELAGLVVEFGRALVAKYGCWGVYTSHVQVSDSNGLGGALARLSVDDQEFLADALLWQKVPYRLAAGHPLDQVAPRDPHEGTVAWDPHDYYRVPTPWEGCGGWWIRQFQGDVRDLPGNLRQADVGDIRTTKIGDAGSHISWLRRRLVGEGAAKCGTATSTATSTPTLPDTFDESLDSLVRAMQTQRGLVVDGVVGPRTIAALAWPPVSTVASIS